MKKVIFNLSKDIIKEKSQLKYYLKSMIIFGIIFIAVFLLSGNTCIIKKVFGIPCLGCGMTRAYLSLLRLDIKAAFYYHPLFIFPALIGIVLLLKSNKYISRIYKSNFVWTCIIIIFLIVWIIRMVLLFPQNAPMDFNKNAIIIKVFSYFYNVIVHK